MSWFSILKVGNWIDELTSNFAWDELIEVTVYKNEGEIVITHELSSRLIEHYGNKFEIEFMSYNKSPTKPRYKYHIRRKEA